MYPENYLGNRDLDPGGIWMLLWGCVLCHCFINATFSFTVLKILLSVFRNNPVYGISLKPTVKYTFHRINTHSALHCNLSPPCSQRQQWRGDSGRSCGQCLGSFAHLNLFFALASLRYGFFLAPLPSRPAPRSRLFTVDVETGDLRVLFNWNSRGSIVILGKKTFPF